jgi:molybdopterin-guanine dinucleotide biosynthesis protein
MNFELQRRARLAAALRRLIQEPLDVILVETFSALFTPELHCHGVKH